MAFHQASKHAPILAGEAGRLGHVARRPTEHFLNVVSFEGVTARARSSRKLPPTGFGDWAAAGKSARSASWIFVPGQNTTALCSTL